MNIITFLDKTVPLHLHLKGLNSKIRKSKFLESGNCIEFSIFIAALYVGFSNNSS